MRATRRRAWRGLMLVGVMVLGCARPTPVPGPEADLTGTWQGEWRGTGKAQSGPASLVIEQFNLVDTAAVVRGRLSITGGAIDRTDQFEGTVSGKALRLSSPMGMQGEMQINGDEMSGYLSGARGAVSIQVRRTRR